MTHSRRSYGRRVRSVLLTISLVGGVSAVGVFANPPAVSAAPAPNGQSGPNGPDSGQSVHNDSSPPLRTIPSSQTRGASHPARTGAQRRSVSPAVAAHDTSGQSAHPNIPAVIKSFDAVGAVCNCEPPDDESAVGTTQVIAQVNSAFEVFDKAGNVLLAPKSNNTIWAGFGGGCQTNNDGDGTILWDDLANRWVFQQFAVSTTPFLDCIAVSQTADATGVWNRYAFQFAQFPDYPKMGVWPDAYYVSFNLFDGVTSNAIGPELCAANRTAMLAGNPATIQCFFPPNTAGVNTILPASMDGATPPAAGTPEWFVGISPNAANALAYWKLHVDFTTPANSTLSAQTNLPVAAFTEACLSACVPQPGTPQKLDTLGDRLMYRLAYRNFGNHEAMVVSHAIVVDGSIGERWYELRPSGTTLSVFQQGNVAPDTTARFLGSIAMDQAGDMALGYAASSSTVFPSVRYTGRLVGDPAGTMPQGEGTIISGSGSQDTLSRWGDYSEMSVDPVDDCTFWYLNEYYKATGSFSWSTRMGSFKFASCGGGGATVNPPQLAKAFGAPTMPFGGSTSLTFTVTNPNASASLSGVGFTDTLPSGLVVSTPNGLTGSCGGGTITATAGSGSVSLVGAVLAAAANCTFGVNVTATSLGTKVNTTSAVTSVEGGNGNPANATVTVGKASTTTTVTVIPSNPSFGSPITFQATVAPSGSNASGTSPTGTVAFFLDGAAAPLATVPLGSGGTASLTIGGGLGAGSHTIKASYSGDPNFLASDSAPTPFTVSCTRTITGTHGAVVAGSGSTCILNAQIGGSITVLQGASLDVENSTVNGSISGSKTGAIRICSTSAGSLSFDHASGFVLIADTSDDNCGVNTFSGSFTLTNNTHGVEAIGNHVAGAVTVFGNSGAGIFPEDSSPEIQGNGP